MLINICRVFAVLIGMGVFTLGAGAQETVTGTVVSYGTGFSTRLRTGSFTLRINRYTSDDRAQRLLGYLQSGQDERLLNELDNEDVGTFSINGKIGPRVNVARESMVNGQRRIIAVLRRWMNFGEIRGGYRSTDYPYSVIELYIDPRTGKGEGTFIAAAKIRWRSGTAGRNQIEIEDFSTFPARMMGVTVRGGMSR